MAAMLNTENVADMWRDVRTGAMYGHGTCDNCGQRGNMRAYRAEGSGVWELYCNAACRRGH